MKAVVLSLKRLYEAGKLTKEQVKARVDKGTINQEEYNYIVGVAANGGE